MATIKVTKVLCDICGTEDEAALKYEIRQGTRKRNLDLCAKDSKQVETLMEAGGRSSTVRSTTATGKRRGRPPKVTTLEEIEASKA